MEDLKFEIDGIEFEHNLNVWELNDVTSTCGYLRGSSLNNPMWYAPDAYSGAIPDKGATLAQAQAALEAHTTWLVEIMLQSPSRLEEVRALLAIEEARKDIAESENVLAIRRARLDAALGVLAQLRGES